ncbi:Vps5 C terminal like-domain-containing protein [Panaeolus papilionaceus]|nr:Vps5 C terminal like-domain-containing protein [Panaeolus papilionaceus]
MDGFDDLLAPSSSALEANPFANPFESHRSSSPDPWASPFASQETEGFGSSSSDPFSSNPFASSSSSSSSNIAAPDTPTEEQKPSDPLDSAALNAEDEDDDEPLANLRTPGFRESVVPTSNNFSETATIRPTEPEPFEASGGHDYTAKHTETIAAAAAVVNEGTTRSSTPSSMSHHRAVSRSGSGFGTPTPVGDSAFKSPLESQTTSIERSLGGLSLGGEALGGWHTEPQTPWQSEHVSTPLPPPARSSHTDDDSDDDKPILQTLNRQHDRDESPNNSRPARDDNGLQPVFVITVDDPQKVGDPIRSFTMYTVHTRTTSPLFQKSAFSVLRRYSDFLWLYETLSNNNPGVVVPPVPEKNSFGRFDDQFVKQRRLALEKCIQKTANHPVLSKDPDLKLFLESDTFALDIKHRKAEIAHERGGFMASIGQTITGPRFYETDEWFDRQKVYLDSLETQLRGLVKAIETVSKHRSEMAVVTGEFAHNFSELSSADVGKQLSQSLAGLADVERKAQDLQVIQAEQDITTLTATVDEYARLINSVRMAFNSRVRTYHSWKQAESDLLKTKQTHEKNRAQGRIPPDRLGFSLSQIAEAERRASESKLEYEHVSKLVKTEVARFEQERIDDFKDSLHAFLEGMISRQKELISAWENYQQNLLKRVGGGGPAGASAAAGGSSVSA